MDGISNVAFTIFGIEIYWYAVMIVTGMVLGGISANYLVKKRGFAKETIIDLMIFLLPAAIVGARLYYVIFAWDSTWTFVDIFKIRDGGLAIYGGVIAGAIVAILFCRIKKFSRTQILSLIDCLVVGLILGQAIGRWGNFFNQEAHGTLIQNSALQFFPMGVLISGEWYYATFFYEFVANIIGFGLLFYFNRKFNNSRGFIFCGYLVWHGISRGIIEGMRTDSLYIFKDWLGEVIRVSQVLSGLMVIAGLVLAYIFYKKGYFTIGETEKSSVETVQETKVEEVKE